MTGGRVTGEVFLGVVLGGNVAPALPMKQPAADLGRLSEESGQGLGARVGVRGGGRAAAAAVSSGGADAEPSSRVG